MLYKKAPPLQAADVQSQPPAILKEKPLPPGASGWPLQLGNFAYQVGFSSMRGTVRPSRKHSVQQMSAPLSPGMAEFLAESPALISRGGQDVLESEEGGSFLPAARCKELISQRSDCTSAAEKERVLRRQAYSDYSLRVERALSGKRRGNSAPRNPPKRSPLSRSVYSGGFERNNPGVTTKQQGLKPGQLQAPPMRTPPHLRRAFTSMVALQSSSCMNEGENQLVYESKDHLRSDSVTIKTGAKVKLSVSPAREPFQQMQENAAHCGSTKSTSGGKGRWPDAVVKKQRAAARPPIPRTPSPLSKRRPSFEQSDAPVTSATTETPRTTFATLIPGADVQVTSAPSLVQATVTSGLTPATGTHVAPAAGVHVTAEKALMTSAGQSGLEHVIELDSEVDGGAADVTGGDVTLKELPVKEDVSRMESKAVVRDRLGEVSPAEEQLQVASVNALKYLPHEAKHASSQQCTVGGKVGSVNTFQALQSKPNKLVPEPVHTSVEALREVGSVVTLGALISETARGQSNPVAVETETIFGENSHQEVAAPLPPVGTPPLDVASVRTLSEDSPRGRIHTSEKTANVNEALPFEDSEFRAGLAALGKLKLKADPGSKQEWVETDPCFEIWDELKEEIRASSRSGSSGEMSGKGEKVKWDSGFGSGTETKAWVLNGKGRQSQKELEEAEKVIRDWKRSLRRCEGSQEMRHKPTGRKVDGNKIRKEEKGLAKRGCRKLGAKGFETFEVLKTLPERVTKKAAQRVTLQKVRKGLTRKTLTLKRSKSKAADEKGKTRGTPLKAIAVSSSSGCHVALPRQLLLGEKTDHNATSGKPATARTPISLKSRHVTRKARVNDSPLKIVLEGIKIVVLPKEDVSSPALAHEVTSAVGQPDMPSSVQLREQTADMATDKNRPKTPNPSRDAEQNPSKTPATTLNLDATKKGHGGLVRTRFFDTEGLFTPPRLPSWNDCPALLCEYTPHPVTSAQPLEEVQRPIKEPTSPPAFTPSPTGSPLPWCGYAPSPEKQQKRAQTTAARKLQLDKGSNQKAMAGRIVGIREEELSDESGEVQASTGGLGLPLVCTDELVGSAKSKVEEMRSLWGVIQMNETAHVHNPQLLQVKGVANKEGGFRRGVLDEKSAEKLLVDPQEGDNGTKLPRTSASDESPKDARVCASSSPREEEMENGNENLVSADCPQEPPNKKAGGARVRLQAADSSQNTETKKGDGMNVLKRAVVAEQRSQGSAAEALQKDNLEEKLAECGAAESSKYEREQEAVQKIPQDLLPQSEVPDRKQSALGSAQKERDETASDRPVSGAAAFFRRLRVLSQREMRTIAAEPEGDQSVAEGLTRSLSEETEGQLLEDRAENGAKEGALSECEKEETQPNGERYSQGVLPTNGVVLPKIQAKLESHDHLTAGSASDGVLEEDASAGGESAPEGDSLRLKEAKRSPEKSGRKGAAEAGVELEARGEGAHHRSAERDSAAAAPSEDDSSTERLFGAAAFFLGARRSAAPAFADVHNVGGRAASVLCDAPVQTAKTSDDASTGTAVMAQPKPSPILFKEGTSAPQSELCSPKEQVFNAAVFFGRRMSRAVAPLQEQQELPNSTRAEARNSSVHEATSAVEDAASRRGSVSLAERRFRNKSLDSAQVLSDPNVETLRRENERLKAEVLLLQGERTRIAKQMEANNLKASGNSALKGGSFEEAKRLYNRALELRLDDNDFNAVVYTNRAAANLALGFPMEAMADCAAALRVDAHSVGAVLRKADTCLAIGDWETALKDLSALEQTADKTDEVRRKAADLRAHMWRAPAHLDLYGILELPLRSNTTALKAAYKRLALRHHPDRAGARADFVFQYIARAYRILSDPGEKRKYDALLSN